jgi:hypothetical protein
MDIFAAHLDTLQSIILSHQYHQDVNKKCPCGAETASYRCEECFDPPMLCKSCIISAHIKTPLHHIGEWSGTHFNRTSLFALGASLCLGHSGDKCRHRLPGPGRSTVVVHTNGIHQVRIEYCRCELPSEYSDALQLAQSRLFPATMERPETAFTFDVLNDFHLHSLTSKKAVMDYVDALRKHTNSAFPHNVPVRMLVALKSGSYLHHLRIGTKNSIMSNASGVISQLRGEPAKLSELTAFLHKGAQVL